MFLHGGWLHLGSNMLYLWIFSDNVEDSMGSVKFILFNGLCGIGAALSQSVIDPYSVTPMVGASGGIAGVLGAYILLHPKAAVRVFMLILILSGSLAYPPGSFWGYGLPDNLSLLQQRCPAVAE